MRDKGTLSPRAGLNAYITEVQTHTKTDEIQRKDEGFSWIWPNEPINTFFNYSAAASKSRNNSMKTAHRQSSAKSY